MCTFRFSIKLLSVLLFNACFIQGFATHNNFDAFFSNHVHEDSEWKNLSHKREEEFPIAVLVELNESFVDRIKMFWGKQNTTSLPLTNTLLATFDSFGLHENFPYEESSLFLQAVENLTTHKATVPYECPTLHVLNELVQNNHLSDGSILLMTGSKPLDLDLSGTVAETLKEKNCQLSVLWFGEKNPDQYAQLRDFVLKSGGKFGFYAQEAIAENSMVEESNFQRKRISPEILSSFKFPEGNESVRKVSEAMVTNARATGNSFIPFIVEVASGASLENRQGNQIPFTVKNTLSIPVAVVYGAKLNEIPQIIQPQRSTLQPSQTETIKVHLQPNPNTQPSASSTLTFTVFGPSKQYSRSAIISPLPLANNDRREPYIKHRYDGDCSKFIEPQTCENNQWSLEITLHDEDSGLLKVISEPPGLLFQTEFLAGIKQQVSAFYTASCCHPKVDIWAEDLKGNYVKKSYDVLNQSLLAGEIAAIVVGVILLVFLILAIIVGVVFYKRRNRRNLVIPRTTGSR